MGPKLYLAAYFIIIVSSIVSHHRICLLLMFYQWVSRCRLLFLIVIIVYKSEINSSIVKMM